LQCLDTLRSLNPAPLLINQHVRETFSFSAVQLDRLEHSLRRRAELLAALFPWKDPNMGIDERWAQLLPYGQKARLGERITVAARLLNHSDQSRPFQLRLHVPSDWEPIQPTRTLSVPPRAEREVEFVVEIRQDALPGLQLMTLDVAFEGWDLRHWCEAMVELRP
jgi:hypothetical protein